LLWGGLWLAISPAYLRNRRGPSLCQIGHQATAARRTRAPTTTRRNTTTMETANTTTNPILALWGLPQEVAPYGDAAHIDADANAAVSNARLYMRALANGTGDRAAILDRLADLSARFALLAGAAERIGRAPMAADLDSWSDGLAGLVAKG
jgi:hypothetical protein